MSMLVWVEPSLPVTWKQMIRAGQKTKVFDLMVALIVSTQV